MKNRWNKKDLALINQLMSYDEKETMNFMTKMLIKYYKKEKVLATNGYILGFGSLPIALVCHCDTVEDFIPTRSNFIYDPVKNIGTTINGLGLDDRLGLFTIIKLLDKGYLPNIILTAGEERGGIGASQLVSVHPKCPFPDIKYLLELDRAGCLNFVMYSNGDKELENYIQNLTTYIKDIGSYSDVETIGPAWNVGFANLSISYYNEHTHEEYVNVGEWYESLAQIEILLKDSLNCQAFEYIEQSQWYNYWSSNDLPAIACGECGVYNPEMEYVEVLDETGSIELLCKKCAKAIAAHCSTCSALYIPENTTEEIGLCPYCDYKKFKKIKF